MEDGWFPNVLYGAQDRLRIFDTVWSWSCTCNDKDMYQSVVLVAKSCYHLQLAVGMFIITIHNSVNQHESAALHAESVLLLLPINSKTNDFFHTNSGLACVLNVEPTITSLDHWYIYLWNTKVVRQTVLSLSFVRRLSRRGRGCLIFEKWCGGRFGWLRNY